MPAKKAAKKATKKAPPAKKATKTAPPKKAAPAKKAPAKKRTKRAPKVEVRTKVIKAKHSDDQGSHEPVMLGEIDWRDGSGGKRSNPESNKNPWLVVQCRTVSCDYRVIVEQSSLAQFLVQQASS